MGLSVPEYATQFLQEQLGPGRFSDVDGISEHWLGM
jgi:hypothetical protein